MVKSGPSLAVVSKVQVRADQTLHHWVSHDQAGKLSGPGSRPMSLEQIEIARLRAERARVKMEGDTLGSATAYFAKERAARWAASSTAG